MNAEGQAHPRREPQVDGLCHRPHKPTSLYHVDRSEQRQGNGNYQHKENDKRIKSIDNQKDDHDCHCRWHECRQDIGFDIRPQLTHRDAIKTEVVVLISRQQRIDMDEHSPHPHKRHATIYQSRWGIAPSEEVVEPFIRRFLSPHPYKMEESRRGEHHANGEEKHSDRQEPCPAALAQEIENRLDTLRERAPLVNQYLIPGLEHRDGV